MKKELSRITIDIPVAIHKRFKSFAAEKGKSMREVVVDLIQLQLSLSEKSEKECLYSHEPNAKTIAAIKEARKRKNIVESKDLEDLFSKLGM